MSQQNRCVSYRELIPDSARRENEHRGISLLALIALALSTLLFELTMLRASTGGMTDRIEVGPRKFTVIRGSTPIPNAWSIDGAINLNGFVANRGAAIAG
ncbi:MAG: hypothetical protein ACYDAE_00840 [Steroidobacteraceae bacterium]